MIKQQCHKFFICESRFGHSWKEKDLMPIFEQTITKFYSVFKTKTYDWKTNDQK